MNPFAAWLEALRRWFNPPLPPSDSRQIVFEWIHNPEQDQGATIGRANLDGTGRIELTDRGFRHWGPNPSNDGQTILYRQDPIGHRGSLQQETWLMDEDGTNKRLLQQRGDHGFRDAGHHEWDVDDETIVFAANHPDHRTFAIYRMGADGTDPGRLTSGDVLDADPSVCPDGRILFTRRPSIASTGQEIWVMNADGSNQQRLTFDERDGRDPQAEWDVYASPNGERRRVPPADDPDGLVAVGQPGHGHRRSQPQNRRRRDKRRDDLRCRPMAQQPRSVVVSDGTVRVGSNPIQRRPTRRIKTVILPADRQSGFRQPIPI